MEYQLFGSFFPVCGSGTLGKQSRCLSLHFYPIRNFHCLFFARVCTPNPSYNESFSISDMDDMLPECIKNDIYVTSTSCNYTVSYSCEMPFCIRSIRLAPPSLPWSGISHRAIAATSGELFFATDFIPIRFSLASLSAAFCCCRIRCAHSGSRLQCS